MGNGNTASSSRRSLSRIIEGIILWRSRADLVGETRIPWKELHLYAVLGYVQKMEKFNSNFCAYNCAKLSRNEVWRRIFEPQNSKKFAAMVVNLMQELRELFEVPKLPQSFDKDKTLKKKIEPVVAFIVFVIQLLDCETEFIVLFEDRIACLKKELRFLVSILGDISLLSADQFEKVQNLLGEFEAVADEGGSLARSFIFTTHRRFNSGRMDEALCALFEHIKLLKDNIMESTNLLPKIIRAYINWKTADVDSLSIVDTVLNDIEGLKNRKNSLVVVFNGQIEALNKGLTLSLSLLKDIKVPRNLEIEEILKETVMRIRDVAYEAEYLINTLLFVDVHPQYLTIRFTDVINKIELVGTELQEINKNL